MWRTTETQKKVFEALNNSDELIVFDVETTGRSPQKDRIIQLSAIKYTVENRDWAHSKFNEIDRLDIYIKPYFAVDEVIEELTGITNEFLKDKPYEEDVFGEIYKFFGDSPLVAAYNSHFDTGFLYNLYLRNEKELKNAVVENKKFKGLSNEIDVLKIARDLVDSTEVENFKLATIVSHYGLDEGVKFHSAIEDTQVTAKLLSIFLYEYKEGKDDAKDEKKQLKFMWATYWNKYGHKMERIYINTDCIKLYYDIYNKKWNSKNDDLSQYDMEDLRTQIFDKYNVSSEEELVKKMRE